MRAAQPVQESARASENACGKAQTANDGLQVFGTNGGLQKPTHVCQKRLPALVCNRDGALDGVDLVAEVLENQCWPLLFGRVTAEAEPLEEADSDLHVNPAVIRIIGSAYHIVHVHRGVKT